MDITYDHTITGEELNALRQSVGWSLYSGRQLKASVENSFFIVTARAAGRPVGLTRIISDGGMIMHIVDVIVHPDFQGHDIGRELIQRTMDHIEAYLEPGETAFLTLMSAYGKEEFYEKFGFVRRPYHKLGYGMSCYVRKNPEATEIFPMLY